MLHPGLVIWSSIGLLGGPVWFFHGFSAFRRKRLIENTPTARIRSMAMGLVEVNGRIAPRSEMLAPFSGRTCAYWEVDIATGSSGQNGRSGSWRVVHRNHSGQPFFLSDDTGTAMVFPAGAECRVNFGVEEECSGIALPDCYGEYLKENCHAVSLLWRTGTMRFRERILEDGQHAFVLGTAMPRGQAFRINDDELAATGTDGDAYLMRHKRLDDQASATIRKGPNEPTFIISQSSEREITLSLALKAFGGMIGGPIAALFGLAYWLTVLASFRSGG